MKITFSKHAKERLKQREISQKLVRSILDQPDEESVSFRERRLFRKKINDKILEVVTIMEDNYLVIVTAYYL